MEQITAIDVLKERRMKFTIIAVSFVCIGTCLGLTYLHAAAQENQRINAFQHRWFTFSSSMETSIRHHMQNTIVLSTVLDVDRDREKYNTIAASMRDENSSALAYGGVVVVQDKDREQFENETSIYWNEYYPQMTTYRHFPISSYNGRVRKPVEKRSYYYAVNRRIPTFNYNPKFMAINLDYFTLEMAQKAITQALAEEKLVTSARNKIFKGSEQYTVIMFSPTKDKTELAFGFIGIGTFCNQTLLNEAEVGLTVYLYDITDRSAITFLNALKMGNQELFRLDETEYDELSSKVNDSDLSKRVSLIFGKREWELVVLADETFRPYTNSDLIVFIVSIVAATIAIILTQIWVQIRDRNRQLRIQNAEKSAHHQLMGYMCHELRNPLHAATYLANCIQLHDNDKITSNVESLDHLKAVNSHLLDIMNGFLDVSQLNFKDIRLNCCKTNLSSLVRDIFHQYDVISENETKGQVAMKLHIDKDLCDLYFSLDAVRIRQILSNGLSNALKHTEHGSILLSLVKHEVQEKLICMIQDTGTGIGMEDPELLFADFVQGDLNAKGIAATGLGLPISRKLAEKMNGELTIQNRMDTKSGCQFILTLPFEPIEDNQITVFTFVPEKSKILVCDDDPLTLKIVERQLVSKIGYNNDNIRLVSKAHGLFEVLQDFRPDLVLIDLHLGAHYGDRLAILIRKLNYNTAIVACSGSSIAIEEFPIFDSVLMKPYSVETLQSCIVDGLAHHHNQDTKAKYWLQVPLTDPSISIKDIVIWLCDDDAEAKSFSQSLLSSANSQSKFFVDGQDLYESWKESNEKPDVIVLDIIMKRSNGLQICKRLREEGFMQPILASTGNFSRTNVTDYFDDGLFKDVIVKPYTLLDFNNCVLRNIK